MGVKQFIKRTLGAIRCFLSGVHIGDGSWIGCHCAIVGDVHIGRHCVVGANSVVTRNVPDFCVVAGAPARIVKRFDLETGEWMRGVL